MELTLVSLPAEEGAQHADPAAADSAGAGSNARPAHAATENATPLDLTDLSRRIARGDEYALAELYNTWFDKAVALARLTTRGTPLRDEAACLDIVQDSFIRIVRSIKPMATSEDVHRWLARVVKTTALDHLRQETRRIERERRAATARRARTGEPDQAALTSPDAHAQLTEQLARLQHEVAQLSQDEQVLLGLRFVRDQTLEQAAAAAGITGGAAHGRLRRALDRLRLAIGSVFHE